MPSSSRRSVVAALGTLALAGCADLGGSEDPPAGTLRFVNDDDLPHAVSVRVLDVGTAPGEAPGAVTGDPTVEPAQRTLTASTVLEPDESRTYRAVFTNRVWYGVEFALDGEVPDQGGRLEYHPAPGDDAPGETLTARVLPGGEFTWVVSATDDPGPFSG
jgi:hypothetical protein